jgi:hypothetical protein
VKKICFQKASCRESFRDKVCDGSLKSLALIVLVLGFLPLGDLWGAEGSQTSGSFYSFPGEEPSQGEGENGNGDVLDANLGSGLGAGVSGHGNDQAGPGNVGSRRVNLEGFRPDQENPEGQNIPNRQRIDQDVGQNGANGVVSQGNRDTLAPNRSHRPSRPVRERAVPNATYTLRNSAITQATFDDYGQLVPDISPPPNTPNDYISVQCLGKNYPQESYVDVYDSSGNSYGPSSSGSSTVSSDNKTMTITNVVFSGMANFSLDRVVSLPSDTAPYIQIQNTYKNTSGSPITFGLAETLYNYVSGGGIFTCFPSSSTLPGKAIGMVQADGQSNTTIAGLVNPYINGLMVRVSGSNPYNTYSSALSSFDISNALDPSDPTTQIALPAGQQMTLDYYMVFGPTVTVFESVAGGLVGQGPFPGPVPIPSGNNSEEGPIQPLLSPGEGDLLGEPSSISFHSRVNSPDDPEGRSREARNPEGTDPEERAGEDTQSPRAHRRRLSSRNQRCDGIDDHGSPHRPSRLVRERAVPNATYTLRNNAITQATFDDYGQLVLDISPPPGTPIQNISVQCLGKNYPQKSYVDVYDSGGNSYGPSSSGSSTVSGDNKTMTITGIVFSGMANFSLDRVVSLPSDTAPYIQIQNTYKNTSGSPITFGFAEELYNSPSSGAIFTCFPSSSTLPGKAIGSVQSAGQSNIAVVGLVNPYTGIFPIVYVDNGNNPYNTYSRDDSLYIANAFDPEDSTTQIALPGGGQFTLEYYILFAPTQEEFERTAFNILSPDNEYIEDSNLPFPVKKALLHNPVGLKILENVFNQPGMNQAKANVILDQLQPRVSVSQAPCIDPTNIVTFHQTMDHGISLEGSSNGFGAGGRIGFSSLSALSEGPNQGFAQGRGVHGRLLQEHQSFRMNPKGALDGIVCDGQGFQEASKHHEKFNLSSAKGEEGTIEEVGQKLSRAASYLPKALRIGDEGRPTNVWIQPYTNMDDMTSYVSDGVAIPAGRGMGYGAIVGADQALSNALTLGGFLSWGYYRYGDLEGLHENKINVWQPGFYGTWSFGKGWDLQNVTSVGFLNYQTQRKLDLGIVQYEAKAQYSGFSANTKFKLEKAFVLPWVTNGFMIPYGSLGYNYLGQGSYEETGASALGLRGRSLKVQTVIFEGGLQYLQNTQFGAHNVLSPYLQLGVRYVTPIGGKATRAMGFVGSADSFSSNAAFRKVFQGVASIGLSLKHDFDRPMKASWRSHYKDQRASVTPLETNMENRSSLKKRLSKGVLGGFLGYEGAYSTAVQNHQAIFKIAYQF